MRVTVWATTTESPRLTTWYRKVTIVDEAAEVCHICAHTGVLFKSSTTRTYQNILWVPFELHLQCGQSVTRNLRQYACQTSSTGKGVLAVCRTNLAFPKRCVDYVAVRYSCSRSSCNVLLSNLQNEVVKLLCISVTQLSASTIQ